MKKKGGKAIAAGAYGCVFRPRLKCENDKDNQNTSGVSKLMETEEANLEMDEIEKINKNIKDIPNAENHFMINNISMCKPKALSEEDKIDFDNKCKNFVDDQGRYVSASNVNNMLDDLSIINMPDLGIDLHNYISANVPFSDENFKKFNRMMINLIKNGVVPMNENNVIHHDLKDQNVMVDNNDNTIIVDWGFAGVSSPQEIIPKNIMNRPFQFNTPFSSMLINSKFKKNYKDICNNNVAKNLSRAENIELIKFLYARHVRGKRGHENYLTELITKMDPSKKFVDLMANYNADILDNFVKDCNFDMEDYFTKVYIFNCDVWGICSTFFKFLTNKEYLDKLSPELKSLAVDNYYKIIFNICFEKGNEKINIGELTSLLAEISDDSTSITIEVEPESIPLTVEEKIIEKTPVQTFISRSSKKAVKDISQMASEVVEKTFQVKPNLKKSRKKRCPNGSRRNKKSKKCVIHSGSNKGTIVNSV